MQNFIKRTCVILMTVTLVSGSFGFSQEEAPARIQATLFYKLLGFYNNLGSDDFKIHIVSAPGVYNEMKKLVGMKFGSASLVDVTSSEGPPANGAQVVYVGDSVSDITQYTQSNKVLSITGVPEFVQSGVTLGIGIEADKAKIILNLTSTKAEGVNWNPAILRVSSQVR